MAAEGEEEQVFKLTQTIYGKEIELSFSKKELDQIARDDFEKFHGSKTYRLTSGKSRASIEGNFFCRSSSSCCFLASKDSALLSMDSI